MPIQSTDAVNQQAPVKRLRMQDQRSSQMTGIPELTTDASPISRVAEHIYSATSHISKDAF